MARYELIEEERSLLTECLRVAYDRLSARAGEMRALALGLGISTEDPAFKRGIDQAESQAKTCLWLLESMTRADSIFLEEGESDV